MSAVMLWYTGFAMGFVVALMWVLWLDSAEAQQGEGTSRAD